MDARPPAPDPAGPAEQYPGTPRWVKALGLIAVVVLLVVAFILATGLGGPHGPQRHAAGAATAALAAGHAMA